MRHLLYTTLVSLGTVSLSFSIVVFILTLAVRSVDPGQGLGGRIGVGLGSLVLGVVLLGVGYLLGGLRRRSSA
jgi:hypothetical protein